jgi:hypothetical protein
VRAAGCPTLAIVVWEDGREKTRLIPDESDEPDEA